MCLKTCLGTCAALWLWVMLMLLLDTNFCRHCHFLHFQHGLDLLFATCFWNCCGIGCLALHCRHVLRSREEAGALREKDALLELQAKDARSGH